MQNVFAVLSCGLANISNVPFDRYTHIIPSTKLIVLKLKSKFVTKFTLNVPCVM